MRKYLLHVLIISFVFLVPTIIHSAEEEKDRLLVVPLKAQKGIDQEEAILLTDILSVEIHRSGKFTILNRDDMKAILDEKEFEAVMGCDKDNICLLQNVEKLAVNKIIAGNIGKLGGKYLISIRMINEDGENELMEKETCDCAISDLDKTMEKVAYNFLKYMGGYAAQEGSIIVESKPKGAKIYLDGDYIGTTPDSIRRIVPGTYKIEVKMDGYKVWTKSVDVKSSEEIRILAKFEQDKSESYTDLVTGIEFVFVKGGCFNMGDTFGDGESYESAYGKMGEAPIHEVCVDDFYIGKYEVTQEQWENIMGNNPSKFKNGSNFPVEMVSWDDVQDFLIRLFIITEQNYRLPTEAEWEYAARSGGKREKFAGFSNENELYRYANFCDTNCGYGDEYHQRTESQNDGYGDSSPIGNYKPNGLGIYDMIGNVWEWCSDWYGMDYYKNSPRNNPKGASSGSSRVIRGGGWDFGPWYARTSYRDSIEPDVRDPVIGFRIATRLAQADVDLYKISKLLGHKDIKMTQRYSHHCPDSLRDGVEILEVGYNLTTMGEKECSKSL